MYPDPHYSFSYLSSSFQASVGSVSDLTSSQLVPLLLKSVWYVDHNQKPLFLLQSQYYL